MDPELPNEPYEQDERLEPIPVVEQQVWLAQPTLTSAPGILSSLPPMYDLRPLTTGEVLDRTFSVYRSRFWLFAGIAAVSGVVQVAAAAAQMVFQHFSMHRPKFGKLDATNITIMVIANLLFFFAYSVTQAATVFAVSEIYLGRATSIAESLRATVGRWYAYIAIALWQLGSMIWLPTLLIAPAFAMITLIPGRSTGMAVMGGLLIFLGATGGIVGGIIFLLRNSMAVPAAVVERLKIRASMRRSKVLTSGAKGKLFLVGLISSCLYMVVGVLQAPLAFMVGMATIKGKESIGGQAGVLLIGFLGHSLVTPVAMIGFTLVYFDQRVRKEAFDIAVLLGEDAPVAVVEAVPVVVVEAVPAAVVEPLAEPVPPVDKSVEDPAGDGTSV
jgi:hypothetical protein